MTDYEHLDPTYDAVSAFGFPRDPYERKWATNHKNLVVAFFLGSILVMTTIIVLSSSHAVGNTAHVLYPVTTDFSHETVIINQTSSETVIYYYRELNYKVIGYVDVTILLCISLGLDVFYYMQVLYTANFHIQQVPIISTVSIWKWINYGISGGVILFMCALVVGMSNLFNLIYILFGHVIISGLFYVMERRNANLLRRYSRRSELYSGNDRGVKWNYVVFPMMFLAIEFFLITVYFVYLMMNSRGFGHIWFNITVFFISQIMFVSLAIMTTHTYYNIAIFDRFRFSMMIPRAISRMFVTFMSKLALFICIVVVSATDLPLQT